MLKINELTVENIKSGKFEEELPELYDLKNTVENSHSFHKNDNVFDHSVRVLEKLEKLLITSNLSDSRKTLLRIVALFHDIGKKETLITVNGFTSCPNHAEVGVAITKKILEKFDLEENKKQRILYLIHNHQAFFDIVRIDNLEIEREVEAQLKKQKEYLPELILFAIADIEGSQLEKTNKEEFEFRINYLKELIK